MEPATQPPTQTPATQPQVTAPPVSEAMPPQPSQPQTAPPAEPKKSRMGFVVLGVIILAIVALGGGIFVISQANNPTSITSITQPVIPTPTQMPEQTQLETVTIQDASGDVATIEAQLQNL